MIQNNQNWLDLIKKLPSLITGLIAFISALVGFVKLWQGDVGLVTIMLIVVGIGGGILGCAYLSFTRTLPLVKDGKGTWQYPQLRRFALAGLIIIPFLTAIGIGYYYYQQAQPPSKFLILVANFDGPNSQNYRVTDNLLNGLRNALERYQDVEVESLGRSITEAEGSRVARNEGVNRKATIVIWGWYGLTTPLQLTVHFEVLRPPKDLPALGPSVKGETRYIPIAEIETCALQTQLTQELSYLSLFTAGLTRFSARDWKGAIDRFSDALKQPKEPVSALNQSIVYCYRASAHWYDGDDDSAMSDFSQFVNAQSQFPGTVSTIAYLCSAVAYGSRGDYDRAIDDYGKAIENDPALVLAYIGRAFAYGEKEDRDRALADFDKAIRLRQDYAEAYYYRGVYYYNHREDTLALADYNKAISLKPDYLQVYMDRGDYYESISDFNHAIADYDQAIRLNRDYALAYFSRSMSYEHIGDKEKAIADLKKVLELGPDWKKTVEDKLNELEAK